MILKRENKSLRKKERLKKTEGMALAVIYTSSTLNKRLCSRKDVYLTNIKSEWANFFVSKYTNHI